jgi:hypothetical protein
MRHTIGKLSMRAKTFLYTSFQSKVFTQRYGSPKLQESQLWQFRDSHLGVPGQNDIWVLVPWLGTKYTIRWKVVASPKFGSWWILWICGYLWLVCAPKFPTMHWLTSCLVCACLFEWLSCLSIFLVPSRNSSMPFYPSKCCEPRSAPQLFIFPLSSHLDLWWIHQGAWGFISCYFNGTFIIVLK